MSAELEDTIDIGRLRQDGSLARTIEGSLRSTINPGSPSESVSRQVVRALLSDAAGEHNGKRVELDHIIGEGGMGVVHAARQLALGRQVAVKEIRPELQSEASMMKLLQEAWTTGAVEHPNVVPVHDVVRDEKGRPQIVLKRIEGTAWSELMHDAAAVEEKFARDDLLEWNLDILMQVCHAVHYAHSRGIVHRDLKPGNVMVGNFGEVYLVDWGIAVALEDDGTNRLPLARHAIEVAGTPCYMAPEMLGGKVSHIGTHTDVYLLGSILYEILTGRPPHDGPSAMAILTSVSTSNPDMPEEAPAELAQLLRHAMARLPDDRIGSADEFRLAVRAFLRHRGAQRLSDDASKSLTELRNEAFGVRPGDLEQRTRLYSLFSECRFGFSAALKAWPECPDAKKGLERATRTLIEYELSCDEPAAAGRLLAQLPEPDPELSARVQKALEEQERSKQETDRWAALGKVHDRRKGLPMRFGLALLFGTIWTVAPLVRLYWTSKHGPLDWNALVVWPVASGAVALGVIIAWRRVILQSAITVSVSGAILVATWGQLLVHAGGYGLGLDTTQSQVLLFLLWAAAGILVVTYAERRLAPSAVAMALCFVLTANRTDLLYVLMAAANFVVLVNAAIIWWPRRGKGGA